MLLWTVLAAQVTAPAVARHAASDPEQSVVITVRLGAEDVVSFQQAQGVVTKLDLRVRGVAYSIPLQCPGGLRDVRFDSAELSRWDQDSEKAEGTFALFFDMGAEQERRFGKLPRVQISMYRRRVSEMLVTRMTGPSSGFSSKLCATLPVGPVTCRDTRQLQGLAPSVLVEQLRALPTPIGADGRRSDAEKTRRNIYEELLDWGADSVPALIGALKNPDVRLRRNVVLAFGALSGGWWQFGCRPARVDIRPALPALVAAFGDSDKDVRAWAAQAVGNMGTSAIPAVRPLLDLLTADDKGVRISACMALGQIGPGANAALPALRAALSDSMLSGCAARSIQRIDQ
jgi:hypothetical protein